MSKTLRPLAFAASFALALGAAPASAHPGWQAAPPSGWTEVRDWDDRRWNNSRWDEPRWGDGRYDDRRWQARNQPFGNRGFNNRRGNFRCRDEGTGGAVVGAIAGGLLGNQVARRGDKTLGTIIGGVGGALIGREIDRADGRPC